jgi:hypothetical protein
MPPPPEPLCVGEPCNTNSLSPSAHSDAQGVRAKMPREQPGMALPDDQTRSAVAAVRGATSAAEQPVGILIRESVSRLSHKTRQQCTRPSWPRISAVAPKSRRTRVTTSPPPCSHHASRNGPGSVRWRAVAVRIANTVQRDAQPDRKLVVFLTGIRRSLRAHHLSLARRWAWHRFVTVRGNANCPSSTRRRCRLRQPWHRATRACH